MKSNHRTLLAIALSLPLAVILLATFACLPAPVGDPEKSKVDESLSGVYQGVSKDAGDKKETIIAVLRPWDAKTYLLDYMVVGKDDNGDKHDMRVFKAWLTTIAGKTFLTAQPVDDAPFILGKDNTDKPPYWVVLRVDKVSEGLEARMVSPDSDIMKSLKTQAEIEGVIKAHVSDNELYGEPLTFKKLGKEDEELIGSVIKQFFGDYNIK